MTKEETVKIMAVLKAAYPMYYKDMSKEDLLPVVELWYMQFKEYDYNLVSMAVNAWIANDTKGFPPVIGQLQEKLRQLTQPKELTEQEAWNYVLKALRNSLYNSKAEFDRLPEDIRGIVGSHNQLREWAMMDSERVNSVVSSNFMRSYRARSHHEREMMTLPSNVREFIKLTVQDKLLLD